MSTQLRQLLSHTHGRRATVLSQGSNVSPKLVIRALKWSLMIQSQQSVPCSALFSRCWQHRRDSSLENMTQYFYLCLTYFLIDFFSPPRECKLSAKTTLSKASQGDSTDALLLFKWMPSAGPHEKMPLRALIVDGYFVLLLRHKAKVKCSFCRDTSGTKEMKHYSISCSEKEETDQK